MIDKQEFQRELVDSLASGKWSKRLTTIMEELANGVASHRLFSQYPEPKSDLIQDGILHLLEIWTKYNISNEAANPFGYFTHCLFRHYMKLMRKEFKYINLKSDIEEYVKCYGIDYDDE